MEHKFLAKFMELYRSWWTAGIRSAFGCAHRVPRLKPSQKSLSGSKLPFYPFPLGFACCSSRIVGRGFDLRKEFMSVNSSSWPELTHKRLVRELRRSFVFENNHPVKDKDFTSTLNICIVLRFFCGSRVIREALTTSDIGLLLFSEVVVFWVHSKNSENFALVTVV